MAVSVSTLGFEYTCGYLPGSFLVDPFIPHLDHPHDLPLTDKVENGVEFDDEIRRKRGEACAIAGLTAHIFI